MAFDKWSTQRIRDCLHRQRGISERRMFGGLAFMANGHAFVGVTGRVARWLRGTTRAWDA